MMTQLTLQQAEAILQPFNSTQPPLIRPGNEQLVIRQALLQLTCLSEYQTLGICADGFMEGMNALNQYLNALGHAEFRQSLAQPIPEGAVYLKYNTQRQTLYCDAYTGPYRGVLVTCQSHQLNGSGGTYGHLPIDLFS
jgi:Domain of unknown function (DUF1824)